MVGWVKLYRETQNNIVWQSTTPEQKVIFVTLLMMVNFEANSWEWEGRKFNLQPGQTITSLQNIAKAAGKGITIQKVRTALKKFESWRIITDQSTGTGRLITLLNWTKYQHGAEQLTDHLTDEQQTINRQLTPIKEGKKVKRKEAAPSAQLLLGDKQPDPNLKDIVTLYYQLLEQYTGETPVKQWAKDCSIVKKAEDGQIAAMGADKIKDKLQAWFKSADDYTIRNGYPLGLFAKQYNKIITKESGQSMQDYDPQMWYFYDCPICGKETRKHGQTGEIQKHGCTREKAPKGDYTNYTNASDLVLFGNSS